MMAPLFDSWRKACAILGLATLLSCSGCRTASRQNNARPVVPQETIPRSLVVDAVPDPTVAAIECARQENDLFAPPQTIATQLPDPIDYSLDEVIEMGLKDTRVLRNLNARILQNPESTPGTFDPAIQKTDPLFGIDGALSQFDVQHSASINYQKNDNVFNNEILGGGANEVRQDLFSSSYSLSKIAASGTQFSLGGNIFHDANNQPSNLFDHAWSTVLEAEARQPLLQGRGLMFNRIAGPNARPGFNFSSGVVISQIGNDISVAQFQRNLREYVNDVIDAYWQLYLAYRTFDAAKSARDGSLKTWNLIKAKYDSDLPGGEADKEAEAREQYFLFENELVKALNGDGRRGAIGILQAEANLRRLINLPQSDGRLIRPADEPQFAKINYDWSRLAANALENRAEVREQKWRVKRRQLELFASRNFLLPRLDAVATYRNNGFGDDLIGGGSHRFASALKDAASGDHDEWEFGLQLNVPVGRRQASAGVRNAELRLMREKSILQDQEQQIVHDLGTVLRQISSSLLSIDLLQGRLTAARQTVAARISAFEADKTPFNLLLDAQRRLAEAEVAYYRGLVNYELAQESVDRETGELLSKHGVFVENGSDARHSQ